MDITMDTVNALVVQNLDRTRLRDILFRFGDRSTKINSTFDIIIGTVNAPLCQRERG